jgi:hypothetical protein
MTSRLPSSRKPAAKKAAVKAPAKTTTKPVAKKAASPKHAAPKQTRAPQMPGPLRTGPRPRPGRPRNDGKPPRVRRKALPIKVRREILKMLGEGIPVSQIKLRFKRYEPTDNQINAIKYGRTKTVKTPRSDSYDSEIGADTPIRRSNDAVALIRDGLVGALNDLAARTRITPENRIELLKDASLVNQRTTRASLVNSMGRRDAEVILEIIRMYEPNATEEEAIATYRQAVDIVKRRSDAD